MFKTAKSARVFCDRHPDTLLGHGHHSEANVVVTPLRFKPLSKGRPRGPAVIGPGTSATRSRQVVRPIGRRRAFGQIESRISAAGESRVVPIAAPFDDVAVHVVQAPGVGWVTAHFGGPF